MSAQDKKRLPDIVDKLGQDAIAGKFLKENSKKFKTMLEFVEHSIKSHSDDVIDICNAMIEAMKLTDKDEGNFTIGYILGYEYGKFRTEKLNAQHRNNLQK